jgi:TolA-binding protein
MKQWCFTASKMLTLILVMGLTTSNVSVAQESQDDDALRTTGPAKMELPSSENDMDFSAKADLKRNETIEKLKTLLADPKMRSRKGVLIFRLAEQFWQKSKFKYRIEFEEFDKAFNEWVDNGRQGKEPKLDNYTRESAAYKKQALANYKVVLTKYPDYPRLDEVLYIMAFNQYEAGKKKQARKNYSTLIRKFPDSEYVADAYLALGEHYFGTNKLIKATKAYKFAYKVGRKENKPAVFMYALYKLAWCDFNAQEYENALKKFKAVVSESEKAENRARAAASRGGGSRDAIRLKRESLNDMVLTYSQLGEVKEAYVYLGKKAGKERSYHLTDKLSQIYANQGKFQKQIETLRLLLKIDPDYPQAPDFQSKIVAAYSKLTDRDAVRREVEILVNNYGPGSAWYRKHQDDKDLVDRAITLAENRMRELVTDYHRYAQKFKRVEDYKLARDIYAKYLRAFPDSEYAYRLNFFYAEILWDLGEWNKAAGQYDAVVARDKKGEYTRVAAYNAVLAWEKIVKGVPPPEHKNGRIIERKNKKKRRAGKIADVRTIEKIKKGKEYTKKPIPEAEIRLAAACDSYVEVVPTAGKDKKLTDELIIVKFKAGYIYQSYYHFDQAAKRFGELIERWPASKYARDGADMILDSYASRAETMGIEKEEGRAYYVELEKWSRTFSKNKDLMVNKKFASSVFKLMEGASFNNVLATNNAAAGLDKKGQKEPARLAYADAAKKFEGFVAEFPKSQFAPTALYNSQLIYQKANQLDLAIASALRLRQEYKKELKTGKDLENGLDNNSVLNLAGYYEKIANYDESAKYYLEYVDSNKDHKKAPDMVYNSAVYKYGLGKTEEAITLFERYMKTYKKQKDLPQVYLRVAAIHEETAPKKKVIEYYGAFESKYGRKATVEQKIFAKFKQARTQESIDYLSPSRNICKGILGTYTKLSDDEKKIAGIQEAAGYCAFRVLETEWVKYEELEVRGKDIKQVKTALDNKRQALKDIGKKYIDILNYGNGEWGIAGLYKAAEAQLSYVNALRNIDDSALPKLLRDNFDAMDMFRAELENQVFPVEEGAILALEKALEKAFELGIYSEFTLKVEERLSEFKPSEFGPIRELPFYAAEAKPSTM